VGKELGNAAEKVVLRYKYLKLCTLLIRLFLGPHNKKDPNSSEFNKGHQDGWVLKHLSYKEMMKELGSFSLKRC